jgi:hypothetical protein
VHPGECLTTDSSTTLEICLSIGEEDGPSGQRVLLERPASLAQRTIQDILSEIVDGITDIKMALIPIFEREEVPLCSMPQEAGVLARSTTRSNHAIRLTEDIAHPL